MQVESYYKVAQEISFLLQKRLLVIVFLFITAFGIRLYHANTPPLDFHATRQYRSLLIARGYYYESTTSVPEWKKQIAEISRQRQGILEPPVMELLVSGGYYLFGGEHFWIPRFLSTLFWLIGGGFLYLIAKKIGDENAALFSVAFYLFLPFAVSASRSFQPDPLMVMLLLASIYAMLRYDDQPTWPRLAIVITVSALTFFIKPVSLFVVYSAFLAITIFRKGVRGTITDPGLLVFFLTTLLPTLVFYIYGLFIAGVLKVQAQASFLPQLLLDPFFWRGWLSNINFVIGFTALFSALFGVLIFRPGRSRSLLIGMWAGYVIFCLVFDYHIATHDYYHLQLIPIIALSLGSIGSLLTDRLLELNREWYWRVAIGFTILVAFILLTIKALPRPLDRTLETEVRVAEEIGNQVNHSISTVYLASDYGLSLEYHGELSGSPWPLVSDLEWERLAGEALLRADERFEAWFAESSPGYFIVLDLREYEQQPDLKEFLTENYPIFAQSDGYLIFDLQQKQ